jgi:dipeptidyl aminopeptidase/acylaminoacyl peptidase
MTRDGEHSVCAIWMTGFDGGDPRQFTSGLTADTSPCWSPTGDRLAFISDRAERGKASVYVMPADGGEALRVFIQQGDVGQLTWSPNGSLLAFVFAPGESDDDKKRKEERTDWTVWDAEPKYGRLWVLDLETREGRAVSPEDRQVRGYAWAGDSGRIAVNTTPTPRVDDIFLETTVSIVSLDGDAAGDGFTLRGLAEDMVWSTTGDRIAYRAASDKVVTGEYVYSRNLDGSDLTCLTPDYGGTAASLFPIAGGRELLLQSVEGVNSALYRLTWDGKLSPLLDGEPWGAFESPISLDAGGARIAGVWESGRSAPDVWVAYTRTSGREAVLTRRTRHNVTLECVALGVTEIVRWPSDDGVEVQGLLVKPVNYVTGERVPLIVHVHGGPTWAWPNAFYASGHDWAQLLAGRGYAVLMPNPRGSTGRGPAWANAIFADVGGGEYRDLMTGVDSMIERGIADPERLGVGGWSWGGYMTSWVVSQTSRFKAAVMGAGLPNMISDNSLGDIPSANLSFFETTPYHDPEPYFERSAIRHIRNATTPTLILHGEADKRVNVAEGIEMYVALRTLGVKTQLVTYPREGHGIEEMKHQTDLLQRMLAWYDEHLKPASAVSTEGTKP